MIADELLKDVDGWLATAKGRDLDPALPGLEIAMLENGQRKTPPVGVFQLSARAIFGSSPELIAVGDAQKHGVLDLVFQNEFGTIFSIGIEPDGAGNYPPIGLKRWDAAPADGAQDEASFGTATYRLVPPTP